ncbi:MAG: hypothetical protein JNK05_19760 [Myxococcales bacterium]|nr:hypothetical protein [Myxococcales bacterium]
MVVRVVSASILAVSFALAPMQCASRRSYELRREETPAEALWILAERFDAQRNAEARDETLRFLLQHAPGSRFAARARVALETHQMPPHDPTQDDAGAL